MHTLLATGAITDMGAHGHVTQVTTSLDLSVLLAQLVLVLLGNIAELVAIAWMQDAWPARAIPQTQSLHLLEAPQQPTTVPGLAVVAIIKLGRLVWPVHLASVQSHSIAVPVGPRQIQSAFLALEIQPLLYSHPLATLRQPTTVIGAATLLTIEMGNPALPARQVNVRLVSIEACAQRSQMPIACLALEIRRTLLSHPLGLLPQAIIACGDATLDMCSVAWSAYCAPITNAL